MTRQPLPPLARRPCAWVLATLVFLTLSSVGLGQEADRTFPPQSGVLWQPFQEWHLAVPDLAGNPFDIVATVTFAHEASGDRHRTQMFYAGDERWSFRFTGTRTGTWRFVTESEHAELDGWRGEVTVHANPDPHASGFLTTRGSRFVTQIDESDGVRARLYHVYIDADEKEALSDYPTNPRELAAEAEGILDEVEEHGFNALFVEVNNSWFEFGANRHLDHDSEDPSLTSFFVLETLILHAHARGLWVHVWAWGDEERSWTPIGVEGGINGAADRRLQRYIAARLGPLPGWNMSYGFDLDEWVTPEEARAWYDYLHAHLGWPHLLMARETPSEVHPPDRTFILGADKFDVFSSDDRPEGDFYATAVAAFEASDTPVVFERRFVYLRDGVWDMDTTRRALWQFTLAGGAGAIWGPEWAGGTATYPEPEQFRTHAAFWRDRWALDLERPSDAIDPSATYVLYDQAGTRTVVYAESTDAVSMDLTHMEGPHRAVAVDTLALYAEIAIGELEALDVIWQAPYSSDWAIAVGTF